MSAGSQPNPPEGVGTHPGRQRVCIIFNPTARGERAKRALARLQALKGECELKPTLAAGMARTLARQAAADGFATIVAMGGDGTVNEVLNGIGDAPNGFTNCRLAVLPVGTVNVFARELGIPAHLQRAWNVILRGRETSIDLPQIQFQTPAGPEQRWFAQMAGCGLDARAVELMDWKMKTRIGQFAYLVSAWKAMREPAADIRVTGGSSEFSGKLVLLGNGRLYGGPLPLFRNADLRDGLLDVCVFPTVNWFVLLRYACAYVSPRLLSQGSERHFQAASVRLESSVPAPLQLDGEHVGHLPAFCSVRRQVLRVLVPGAIHKLRNLSPPYD